MTSSERMKKLWKTKTWQNKMKRAISRGLRKHWNDPTWRATQSAKQREGWARRGNRPRKKWNTESKRTQSVERTKWWRKNKTKFLTTERRVVLRDRALRTHQNHPDIAKKRTAALKKAWKNPKRRAELCAIAAERLRKQTINKHPYTCRKGRRFNFRSGEQYELGCAKILDARKLTWLYEPRILRLSDGRAYLPDFWVREWKTYVEIKGWERRVDKVEQANKDGFPVLLIRNLSELP